MNQCAKYLGKRSLRSKVIILQTHTHRTDRATWTTKMVGNYIT